MQHAGGARRLRLGTKFILLTSALILITAFIIGLFVLHDEREDNYQLLLDHGRSLAIMIAQNSEYGIFTEDKKALRQIIESIKADPAVAYVFVLNADERILLYKSADSFPIHIPPQDHPHGKQPPGQVRHKDFLNKEDGKQYVDIMAPVVSEERNGDAAAFPEKNPAQGRIIGYIHLGISQESLSIRTAQFLYSIMGLTSLLVILGVMATVFITRRIIAPIQDLDRATQEIADGKLDRRIEIYTGDEVADLARAFNHMLDRLRGSHDEVERNTAELTKALERMKQEIDERERTERALKESERKYRTLFEESRDGIFICTPGGKFLDVNRAGVELFGYPSVEALCAADPRDLYSDPEESGSIRRMLEERGFIKDHEVKMKRNDGDELIVLLTAEVVRKETGTISAYRGVYHDITEKRRLEDQLLQSQKMEAIGQLAGGIAHDFNNILTAIIGYGNLLLMDLPEESLLKDHVEHILSSSERASNLTRSLLAFSRKQVISTKPVELNSVVRTVEKLISRLIGEDIELKANLFPRDVMIMADSGQIEQVLINLCTNARDAMPSGGVLTLATSTTMITEAAVSGPVTSRPGPHAVITVSDTGIGMDGKTREKIFEPFFTTKETGKGTGLGLSIVYGIIKQHNGVIDVSSKPNGGAVFRLFLPLLDENRKPAAATAVPALRGGTETILVAEDEQEVRELVCMILGGSGYRVIAATDGDDALSQLKLHAPAVDLLLLDVIMPKKNGKEVYDAAMGLHPGVKALFMSGYTADIINRKGILDEAIDFIEKPILPHELLDKVRDVLDA